MNELIILMIWLLFLLCSRFAFTSLNREIKMMGKTKR